MSTLRGKRLLVLGCGYLGGAVARAAQAQGSVVTALTRNPATAADLARDGVETVLADLTSADWHRRVPTRPDFLVNCVSSGGGGVEAYRQSYGAGMASVVAWARAAGPAGTAVYTSSTSVYPQGGGQVVTEESEAVPASERGQILLTAEGAFVSAAECWSRWFVLRLAGIYGPGRHYLVDQVRRGEVAGVGSHRLNLIHRDDGAAAILACLEGNSPGGIFNVADDGPARKSEVVGWLAATLAVPEPRFTGEPTAARSMVTPDRVIANGKLKAALGWRPQFPTFREGYASFLSR